MQYIHCKSLENWTIPDYKNLTENAVYGDVYPVWSYSSFALLVPVFLLTDLVKYNPMIIFEGLSYVVTWVLLLWAEGVAWMQATQFVHFDGGRILHIYLRQSAKGRLPARL